VNIFVLDNDPKLAAQYHCNKHVVKMILESCQLLSTAHHILGSGGPLKLTHTNHSAARWARESTSNYDWLYNLAVELCIEYTFRYNKNHKYETCGVLDSLQHHPFMLMKGPMTSRPLIMPTIYWQDDVIQAYRNYYFFDKQEILNYKRRDAPHWFINLYNQQIHHD